MKIDLTQCKTPEDVERAMKPLGEVMGSARAAAERHGFSLETSDEPAARAYREGRIMGALLQVARMARLHLKHKCHAGTSALWGALGDLDEAERAAGVDLTRPTGEDLHAKPRRKRARKIR